MATNEKPNLIGYDPLAWMDEPDITALTEVGAAANAAEAEEVMDTEITESLADSETLDIVDDLEEDDLALADMSEMEIEHEAIDDGQILENLGGDAVMSDVMELEDSELEQAEAISSSPLIQLEGNLSIQHISQLFERFKASLSLNDQLEIDVSAVSSIDTATLQLFVALKKEADKQQKQVAINLPSAKFIESVKLLGLSEILDVE